MKINGMPSPDLRAITTKPVRDAESAETASALKSATSAPPKRRDSVEISDAGRAQAASRVADIRQRILAGAYDATHVIDTVARRILQRGDI